MRDVSVPSQALCCSFCGKDRATVGKLVAGPGVHICDGCVALCNRVLTGRATAAFSAWSTMSDEELLTALPASVAAVDAMEAKLREHVAMLRNKGVSWDRIAAVLGVTRQSAWERFSREN